MKKPTIAILALSATLVGTNAWWVYRAVDSGTTLTYQSVALREHTEALAQSLAILNNSGQGPLDRSTAMSVMKAAGVDTSESFEKDGYLWVGQLGIRFSATGRLERIRLNWE